MTENEEKAQEEKQKPFIPPKGLETYVNNVLNFGANQILHVGRQLERWMVMEEILRKLDEVMAVGTAEKGMELLEQVVIPNIKKAQTECVPPELREKSNLVSPNGAPLSATGNPLSLVKR